MKNIPNDIRDVIKKDLEVGAMGIFRADPVMPDLHRFAPILIKVRDDIARKAGADPENVTLIAIKVVYLVDDEKDLVMVAQQVKVDPNYVDYANTVL